MNIKQINTASESQRRGGQGARRWSRKPKIAGSNPVRAFFFFVDVFVTGFFIHTYFRYSYVDTKADETFHKPHLSQVQLFV